MNPLRSSVIPVSDPAAGLRITEIFIRCREKQTLRGYQQYLFV